MVGKDASKIRFNHNIKLRRAINADTLERMVGKVDLAIIESINGNEEDQVKDIIGKFRDMDNPVYFFPSITDEITLGVADELEYTIYSTLETLCAAIESEQGIKVSTGYNVENDVDSSNDFGQTFEMSEALRELDAADLAKQYQSNESEPSNEPEETEGFGSGSDSLNTYTNDFTGNKLPEVDTYALQLELSELPENVANEITKLRMQLSDARYDYSIAIEDMKIATATIANLEKIISTLKDEKESMQAEFKSIIETSDVLEDPISLSVYQKTVANLNERDSQVADLEAQVAELKQQVESDKHVIAEKMAEIEKLNDRISEIEAELETVNESINSGEVHKDVVADFTEKIEALRADKDLAVKEANELRIKAESDASTIWLLNKNLAFETQYRYASVELFMDLIGKITTKISELNSALVENSRLESKLSDSIESGNKVTADLAEAHDKINELSEIASKLSGTEFELEYTKTKLIEAEAKLTEMSETLTNKESEYKDALDKYVEDASRVLEEIKLNSAADIAKLKGEIEELRKLEAPKDAKIADQESKITSLTQQVEDNKTTIDDLNETVASLNSMIEIKDAQIESKDAELASKSDLIESLNQSIEERDKSIKSRDYTILQKDRELVANADDIKALNDSIEGIEARHKSEVANNEAIIKELNEKVNQLNAVVTSKDYTIGIHSVALEEREAAIEQLKADVEDAKKNTQILEDKIKRADDRFRSTLERLKISGGDIERLMTESESSLSNEDVAELHAKIGQLEGDLETANFELEKIKSDYTELTNRYNDVLRQLSEGAKDISSKTTELSEANIEIQKLTSRLAQLENDKSTLESVKTGAASDEVEAIKNQNSTLVEKNSALTSQLNESRASEEESRRQLARMETELDTYKSLVADLRSGTGSLGGQCTIGNINYNRSAQIISVFGNRSCGITTLAVSIARKLSLNTNVLYIDFDMIAPKGDVIFKKTPVIEVRGAKNTSLGAMTQLSNSLTANEIRGLAIDVEKTKGGTLAYFSGYYWKPNDSVIANTDFQRMFDVLGEYYDYIVVDLGKIGASSFNNSIIKEITSISRKTIAISNNDPFNVKAMLRTLSSMGIDSKSISWAINKVPEVQVGSQNIAVNTKIMEALSGCRVGAFADDLKLRGLPSDFLTCARSNKINFEMFLTQTVFG